jgi:transposase
MALVRCCETWSAPVDESGWPGLMPVLRQAACRATRLRIRLKVVRKRDTHAFEVLPTRWVVERVLAWITGCRRCARGCERLPKATRP